ncbi:MAG: T9SS type A sorting domain-containing protein [Bacteroidota bacterium]
MGRKVLYLAALLIASVSLLFGQGRRVVLMEEATNASCPPCAANNPALQSFFESNFGDVVSVRYHAWWPGFDPMYTVNTPDNRNRINYYGINGVPNYLQDGVNHGVPSDPGSMVAIMKDRLQSPHLLDITVQAVADSDSVKVDVTVIGRGAVKQTSLVLFTAVIERMVVYSTPPGNNGETVFPDVMRQMLPAATGIPITSLTTGDTLKYSLSCPVAEWWRVEDLAAVSWLQSNTTKEVIQANINLPTHSIQFDGVQRELVDLNTVYTKSHVIHNRNSVPIDLRVEAVGVQVAAGWSYQLLHLGTPVDSIVTTFDPGDSLVADLRITTGSEAGSMKVRVLAVNRDDPYGYGASIEHFGIVPNGPVLFVDADGGRNSHELYYAALDSAGVAYTSIGKADLAFLSDQLGPSQFSSLFWNVGWSFPALGPSDVTYMQDFVDQGGNLYIAGQDLGWDIFDQNGSSRFQAARDFYHNYLGANYLADNSGGTSMTGVPGDVVTEGLAFTLGNPYAAYPEQVGPYPGTAAVSILEYNNGKYGAVRLDADTFKTVYMGIGLEQINETFQRNMLIKRILEWFGITTDVDPAGANIPLAYSLDQNYPNPFNPSTEIRYTIAEQGLVTLKVYDLVGREVETLVQEIQSPGRYVTRFDVADRATGVYFYRLTSGQFTSIKKMILMK